MPLDSDPTCAEVAADLGVVRERLAGHIERNEQVP